MAGTRGGRGVRVDVGGAEDGGAGEADIEPRRWGKGTRRRRVSSTGRGGSRGGS